MSLTASVGAATLAAAAGLVAGVALPGLVVPVVLLMLIAGAPELVYVTLSTYLQHNTRSEYRATSMSIAEGCFSIQMLWLFPLTGYLIQHEGYRLGFGRVRGPDGGRRRPLHRVAAPARPGAGRGGGRAGMSRVAVDHLLIATDDLDAAAAADWAPRAPGRGRRPPPRMGHRQPDRPARRRLSRARRGRRPGRGRGERLRAVGGRGGAGAAGWAVRSDDLDATARRLGLDVQAGSRAAADGRVLRWRTAGLERAAAEPTLPFFIAWDAGTPFPGAAGTRVELDRLELRGQATHLAEWLGQADMPVSIRPGPAAVERIVLRGTGGPITIDAAELDG